MQAYQPGVAPPYRKEHPLKRAQHHQNNALLPSRNKIVKSVATPSTRPQRLLVCYHCTRNPSYRFRRYRSPHPFAQRLRAGQLALHPLTFIFSPVVESLTPLQWYIPPSPNFPPGCSCCSRSPCNAHSAPHAATGLLLQYRRYVLTSPAVVYYACPTLSFQGAAVAVSHSTLSMPWATFSLLRRWTPVTVLQLCFPATFSIYQLAQCSPQLRLQVVYHVRRRPSFTVS
jgi:hypothetical protein